jgi:hypothetical protein
MRKPPINGFGHYRDKIYMGELSTNYRKTHYPWREFART